MSETDSSTEGLVVDRGESRWTVTITRPAARNAFDDAMFTQLIELCAELHNADDVRVVVFRGAGDKAFSAGNDISTFARLDSGVERVLYEKWIRGALADVANVPQVTLAAVQGACVGGGLALATHCDLRIATTGARFGYPIARTLGNALSADLIRRCVAAFGEPLTQHMLLTGGLVDAQRAYAVGAVSEVVEPGALDDAVDEMVSALASTAPLTVAISKMQLAAITAGVHDPERDDTWLEAAYGSADFESAVEAFTRRERPSFSQTREAHALVRAWRSERNEEHP